jgi:Holliday junction resolvasome RuvABC endonuclease subunit
LGQRSRLLAVDPSLTCSGWALFELSTERLLGVGKLRSLPPSISLVKRLADLQHRIGQVMDSVGLGGEDAVICEAPTSIRDPSAAFKVEQVRCIFEALGRERSCLVPGRLNPRTVQTELLGMRGPQLKRTLVKSQAVEMAMLLFRNELAELGTARTSVELMRHQDIVDALLLGHVAMNRMKHALRTGRELDVIFEVVPANRKRIALGR